MRLSLYIVDTAYISYLSLFDHRVPIIQKNDSTYLRPLIGIVLSFEGIDFYAPLSSPKDKHLSMKEGQDFIKIANGTYGVINLNNMIPVKKENSQKLDLSLLDDQIKSNRDDKNLVINQLEWCNVNKKRILSKSQYLFNLVSSPYCRKSLKDRCCNYRLLIEKCNDYG